MELKIRVRWPNDSEEWELVKVIYSYGVRGHHQVSLGIKEKERR